MKKGGYWKGITFLLVFLYLLEPICSVGEEGNVSRASKTVTPTIEFLLGPEDVLEIAVWKNAELSKQVIVRPDGYITLPLIGDVKAAGLAPKQLKKSIIEKLKGYQESVVVSVIVLDVRSYNIFILGEVARPGTYNLKRKTSLLQAISIAGGFNQFASKNKILVIRDNAENPSDQEKIKVRFDDIISKNIPGMNLILMPGDTIYVP